MSRNTDKQAELARDICRYAHRGQVDKGGQPYYLHPEYVASKVESADEKVVALLHDVMEDTDFPASVLETLFGGEVMAALRLLKHEDGVPYPEYVGKLKENALARAVKKADLKHNMQLDRLGQVTEKDLARLEKYKKAFALLTE